MTRHLLAAAFLLLPAFGASCASSRDEMGALSAGGASAGTAGGTDGGTAGSTAGTSGGGPGGSGAIFDVGDGQGTAGDGSSGCDKVDFLFVIDNSASMLHNQEALVAAFPGFIDAIQANVQAQDYHILVTDSDDDPTVACEGMYPNVMCGDPSVCGDYPCGSYTQLTSCDKTLGAGVTTPRGGFTENGPCGVPDGQRYITGTQPDLKGTFACIATTGVSGNWDERPMQAAVQAVSPGLLAPGACNEGFLRDDAILVVTVLSTGDYDTSSEARLGDAQAWYDAIVAAKGGNADAIVFLSIVEPFLGCDPLLGCAGSPVYDELVNLFGPRGRAYDIDSDDYVPYFSEAVGLIDTTCDEFVPEG